MSPKLSTCITGIAAVAILALSAVTPALSEGVPAAPAAVTVLRGAPPQLQQQQTQLQIKVSPPPLPSCPEGYFYSLPGGYCYQLIDPVAGRR